MSLGRLCGRNTLPFSCVFCPYSGQSNRILEDFLRPKIVVGSDERRLVNVNFMSQTHLSFTVLNDILISLSSLDKVTSAGCLFEGI